jgi:DNA polymerase-3 subunit delta
MIIKSHDIKNYFTKKSIFLFYGENDGLKDEIINNFFKKNHIDATFNYSEKDILNNLDNFYNQIKSKSFFDNKKLIIITDASDKIKEEIENLLELKLDDISIILVSKILEKKSKLRALFEKNNKLITIPFYKEIIKH